MKDSDAGNEIIATDSAESAPQPHGINRRDLLVGTAGVVALTAAITAQTAAAAQPAAAPAPAPPGPGGAPRAGGPPGGGRGGVIPAGSVTFNTVITKLAEGKQIFSNTIMQPDLEAAKKACEGQDFIWIEMQHSRLTWREVEDLIRVIAQAGSIPFVRVPSANKGDIQRATDAGALGIIVPMVDTIEEARNAVMFTKWPIGSRDNPNTKPWGHRSSGGGQFNQLWGAAYQSNANNNILVMIQIENPQGVGMIDTILEEVPGIDIVMDAETARNAMTRKSRLPL
jgi:2-keto-3-deoxy-L-rhamnonate aldolase RhmA